MAIQPHVVGGRMVGEAFEKATGAKVNVIAVPNDQILEKVTLDMQSGANVFDLVDYWYGFLGAYAHDGMIVDVTNRIAKEIGGSAFLPILWDPYTLAEGKRWGLPCDGDTYVQFYNTEILGRHGLKAPETWDEYLSTAKTVAEAEKGNGIFGTVMLGRKEPFQIGCSYANRLCGLASFRFRPEIAARDRRSRVAGWRGPYHGGLAHHRADDCARSRRDRAHLRNPRF
jgi:multiple sugar transport system substrate-binding protein